MYTIERTRDTKHAPETVWELIAAFNRVEDWHPRVDRSPGSPREEFGVGAHRTCHFSDGTSVVETVTGFEAGRSIDIDLTAFSMPMKRMSGRISITPSLHGSVVALAIHFEPKFGPLGALMAQMMIKPMMKKMIDQVLGGLDEYLAPKAAAA